jgi:hypothetical protein
MSSNFNLLFQPVKAGTQVTAWYPSISGKPREPIDFELEIEKSETARLDEPERIGL